MVKNDFVLVKWKSVYPKSLNFFLELVNTFFFPIFRSFLGKVQSRELFSQMGSCSLNFVSRVQKKIIELTVTQFFYPHFLSLLIIRQTAIFHFFNNIFMSFSLKKFSSLVPPLATMKSNKKFECIHSLPRDKSCEHLNSVYYSFIFTVQTTEPASGQCFSVFPPN